MAHGPLISSAMLAEVPLAGLSLILLYLQGLQSLSVAAAAALAKHEHSLSPRGLVAIYDDAAAHVAGYSGILKLSAKAVISDSSHPAFVQAAGTVRFECPHGTACGGVRAGVGFAAGHSPLRGDEAG